MLAILSCVDESTPLSSKKNVSFIHLNSSIEEDIEVEARPYALAFARALDLKKVYLFYGEKGRFVYDYSL